MCSIYFKRIHMCSGFKLVKILGGEALINFFTVIKFHILTQIYFINSDNIKSFWILSKAKLFKIPIWLLKNLEIIRLKTGKIEVKSIRVHIYFFHLSYLKCIDILRVTTSFKIVYLILKKR